MSIMKRKFKILSFIIMSTLIISGGIYYKLLLKIQIERLAELMNENQIMENELQYLQGEYRVIGQTKNKLRDINMQTKSLEGQVPTYETSIMLMSEIIQYTQFYNYEQRFVEVGTALPKTDENKGYETIPVTISYISKYEDSIKFLEMINRSYHAISIESYLIDNTIQENQDNEDTFLVSKDTVETQLVLHMHYKETGSEVTYPNFMAYLGEEENIFERPLEDSKLELENNTADLDINIDASKRTKFNINLADILRSGDNYSFSAYSTNQEPVYVGLASSKDTKIELCIRDNGYSCVIEDTKGNKNEKKVDIKVENPSIDIISQIQNTIKPMPIVSIYIHNYTAEIVNVSVRGLSLENVVIYNENNKIVEPGTQSGKVLVTG